METILFLIIVNFYCSMQSLKRGQLRPPLYIVDVNLCEGAAMGVHSTIEKLTSETCKTEDKKREKNCELFMHGLLKFARFLQ